MASPNDILIAQLKKYGNYSDDFLRSLEPGQAEMILRNKDPKAILDREYQAWQASQTTSPASAPVGASDSPGAPPQWTTDEFGNWGRWIKKSYLDENGDRVVYDDWQPYPGKIPVDSTPPELPGEDVPYYWTGTKYESNPLWEIAQGKTAAEQAERDRQFDIAKWYSNQDAARWQRDQDWAAQASQARPAVFTPQLQAPQMAPPPEDTPRNWLNHWLWNQDRQKPRYDPTQFIPGDTAPIASNAQEAAAKGYQNWITPQQMEQATQGVSMERQRIVDPYNTNAPGYDPRTGTRDETDQEYQYRTVTVPQLEVAAGKHWGAATAGYQTTPNQSYMVDWARAGGPNAAPDRNDNRYNPDINPSGASEFESDMAKWLQSAQQAEERVAEETWQAKQLGPKTPDWAKGVVNSQWWSRYNPYTGRNKGKGEYQINLKTLGQSGNVVKPVSAQMYQNWLPSQREGYFGLVGAQQAEKGQRVDVGDFMDDAYRQWTSSRTGQQGQRRARAY